jgi:ATP-dependent RNA helicase DDX52/ROK1
MTTTSSRARTSAKASSSSSKAKQALAFAELCGGARFDRKKFKSVDVAVAKSFRREGGGSEGRGEGSAGAESDADEEDDEDDSDDDSDDSDDDPDASSSSKKKKRSSKRASVGTKWTPLREDEANAMRKQYRMRVQGADGACPAPLQGFEELNERFKCGSRLLERMREANFKEPTPIQRQAVPILCAGDELLAIAPTGSGKTLAFLLPIIMKLKSHEEGGPRALLLAPTKELAGQSARILRVLSRGVSGLKSCLLTKATAGNDFTKIDILVATPMRLKALLQHEKINLSKVLYLVLDEADKLFEMGFVEQIDAVVAACDNEDVTRALFSATLPEKVEELARSVMARPVRLTVGERNSASSTIAQRMVFCGHEAGKLLALRQIIREGIKPPVIIFTQSKDRAKVLAKELAGDGLHIGLIHAEMSDSKRQEQVDRFRMGETWVLIATDLMARGMDFVGVSTVINFDFPGSPTSYIHRIGRSGRAGRPGAAITFFTEEDAQRGDLKPIANVMKNSGCDVPEWMLNHSGERGATKRRKRKDGKEDNPRRAPLDLPMGADPKVYRRANGGGGDGKKKTKKKRPSATTLADGEAMPPLPKKWKGGAKRRAAPKK